MCMEINKMVVHKRITTQSQHQIIEHTELQLIESNIQYVKLKFLAVCAPLQKAIKEWILLCPVMCLTVCN